MAVAMRFTLSGGGIDPETYNRVAERLNRADDPPEGLLFHSTGFEEDQAYTFDVWDSEESFQKFLSERLQPTLEEAGVGGDSPPDITLYELHNVWTPDADELQRLSTEESPIDAQRA